MSLTLPLATGTYAAPNDQIVLNRLWQRLWVFADQQYVELGRGVILLRRDNKATPFAYVPCTQIAHQYPSILEQVQSYHPRTECLVLALEHSTSITARLYRLYRLALTA